MRVVHHASTVAVVVAGVLLSTSCSSDSSGAGDSVAAPVTQTTLPQPTAVPSTEPASTDVAPTSAAPSTTSAAPSTTAAIAVTTVDSSSPPQPVVALPQGSTPSDVDPATFTTEIDNRYWPMTPGTRWTYREIDSDGVELEVVVVVTTQTKLIANGVTARVLRDTVTRDGEIVEDTIDWYAQDATGNLWYLGENTAEFEQGVITSTEGSWEAGVDGALAGVMIPADPRAGMTYRQEYYAGHAEDNGEVLALEESADVVYGHFDHLLMTADTSGLDRNALEHKLYAAGIGPILTTDVAAGGREELVTMDTAPSDAGLGALGSPNP